MKTEANYDTYITGMTERQLKDYIHAVGKAANQRLRELEKQGMQNSSAAYRYIKNLAFDKDAAMSATGKGQIKFNLKVRAKDLNALRHVASIIDKFMEAKSSTTAGVKDIYKESYKTFQKNFPNSKITFDEFSEAMGNTLFRNFEKIYGSRILIRIMNRGRAGGLTDQEIAEALRQAGFTEETTDKNAPDLVIIENKLDEFIANKKDLKNNGEGLFRNGEEL